MSDLIRIVMPEKVDPGDMALPTATSCSASRKTSNACSLSQRAPRPERLSFLRKSKLDLCLRGS